MKKILAIAILAAVVAAIVYSRTRPAPADDTPPPVAQVATISLQRGVFPVQITAYGSITAGAAERSITLQSPGIVTAILAAQGQAVTAGEPLARVVPDAQSAADLSKARDAVRAAEAQRRHVAALLASHLATQADLAAAAQTAQDAKANLRALRSLGTGTAYLIGAPVNGIVTAIMARPGMLPAGTELFRLAAANGLVASAGLPEADAAQIRPGDGATLTALNSATRIPAKVALRGAMLDPQTGLIDITLDPQGDLPLGEPLCVTITKGSVTGDAVPRDAVRNDENGDFVFQLDSQGIAHRQPVRLLEQYGGLSILAPDLNPAMPVVTTGAYQLEDGMAASQARNGN